MANAPAAAHTLRILNLLANRIEPMPAGTIARELELPRSTTYRLLTVLIEYGYVAHYPESQRYGLGLAVYELSFGYQRQEPLQRLARPVIQRLVDTTTHNAHFVVLSGRDALYLIEERASGRPLLVTDVGLRLPATLTASGLAILAALPKRQVTALFANSTVLPTGGPQNITELRRVLSDIRTKGYAEENDSITCGLSSVADAVRDRAGHPIAAIAITYPTESTSNDEIQKLIRAVSSATLALSARL